MIRILFIALMALVTVAALYYGFRMLLGQQEPMPSESDKLWGKRLLTLILIIFAGTLIAAAVEHWIEANNSPTVGYKRPTLEQARP